LVPLSAVLEAGRWYADQGEEEEMALVQAAIRGLGLNQLAPFDPYQRIIEYALEGALGQ
jgi:glutamate formiminotransferase/formiminotetrahydrofolate cyclodeaminase